MGKPGVKDRGVNFTTHLYLVPTLRMTGAVILLPPHAPHVMLNLSFKCVGNAQSLDANDATNSLH